jgi:hypothetical protein
MSIMMNIIDSTQLVSSIVDFQFTISTQGLILAQQFENIDLVSNLQVAWVDFLGTGKAGALTIGLVFGYIIRGVTR